jgi:hypothetical protein
MLSGFGAVAVGEVAVLAPQQAAAVFGAIMP